jgi:hypothetical protein
MQCSEYHTSATNPRLVVYEKFWGLLQFPLSSVFRNWKKVNESSGSVPLFHTGGGIGGAGDQPNWWLLTELVEPVGSFG